MTEFFAAKFAKEAPERWRRVQIKDALSVVSEPVEMRDDEVYRLVSIRRRFGGMVDRERLPGRRILTKDLSRVVPGAFIIAKRQVVHGATCIVPTEMADAAVASSYAQLVGTDICEPRFFEWLAKMPAMTNMFYDASQGVVVEKLTLSLQKWMQGWVNLPPLPEQRQIAEVLDTVDEAIRKTEQIIAKLKQVKQGLLHDLLTRGIDDNGELRDPDRHPEQFKDSPLGRIPKGWEVTTLGSILSSIDAGNSPSCPDRPAQGDEWGVLKVSAVRPTGFQADENKAITNSALLDETYEVKAGDLLITRANTYELVGLTCLVARTPPRLMLCDKTLRLNTSPDVDRRYVFFASQMPYVRSQIEINATGSSGSMKNISQRTIRSLRLRLPRFAEQSRIAEAVVAHDERVVREQAELAKLRLLKSGLMEDLLTGRVRVTPLLEDAAE